MPQSLAKILIHTVNQEAHHRKMSFQDEFRQLLKRYQIEFQERYVGIEFFATTP